MNLSEFTSEQMISFCFSPIQELEKRIAGLQKEFVDYCLKVKSGEPFSEYRHNNYLRMIEVLVKCKDAQFNFMKSFLDEK
jgi:hypothetical protein